MTKTVLGRLLVSATVLVLIAEPVSHLADSLDLYGARPRGTTRTVSSRSTHGYLGHGNVRSRVNGGCTIRFKDELRLTYGDFKER